ncbi:neurogenin-1 [Galendromus occidentalis]|uniref:Neurogenin-1 n=1 Tax=Galendromus occidentalis TaxID=34638 RepID=A0AAJ6QQZ6_9ACAR|nr:neurogenin-1 [Galendromus occidentalis]
MDEDEAVNSTSENSVSGNITSELLSFLGQDKENARPRPKRNNVQKRADARKSTIKDSMRILDTQKRSVKQESTSEIDFLTSSTNGSDSLRSRRIEANARERSRVHTIGAAFEALRQCVPSNCDQQKLSKLAILRIAAAYIRALSSLLEEKPMDFALGVEQCTQALLLDGIRSKYPKSVS